MRASTCAGLKPVGASDREPSAGAFEMDLEEARWMPLCLASRLDHRRAVGHEHLEEPL